MPLVSVIIPTYQSAQYLPQSIESVLSQTFKDFELIVVDDGSTDQTKEVLKQYGDKIRVLSQSNRGPSAARNTGIRASFGDYIAFIDADDLWEQDKLEKQIPILKNDSSIGLVYSDTFFFDDKGKWKKSSFQIANPKAGWVSNELFIQNFIPTLTVVIRRVCLENVGLFDESISGPEDYDLWLRISKLWKVNYIDSPLAFYRLSQNQLSHNSGRMLASVIKIKNREFERTPELKNLGYAILDPFYYSLITRCAKACIFENRVSDARLLINEYRFRRGATLRYWVFFLGSWLPVGLLRIIFNLWDLIYLRLMADR